MAVSLRSSRRIFEALKAEGVELVSALPETWLVHLIHMADGDADTTLVRLAKEEEGVGLSMGAHLAGARSAMLMQNHGFLASVNGIVSGAQLYRVPLLMLISQRGEFGESDPWQTEGGLATEHVLDALRIPWEDLEDPDRVEDRVGQAATLAESASRPVALLLRRNLMWVPDGEAEQPGDAAAVGAEAAGAEGPGAAAAGAGPATGEGPGRAAASGEPDDDPGEGIVADAVGPGGRGPGAGGDGGAEEGTRPGSRMRRREALRALYPHLERDDVAVVTNMGAAAAELQSLGHRPNFFYLQHAMGLASSIGLGIALTRPDLKVAVFDGDGSVLMNLGGLTTMARYAPPNLVHVTFDNESLLSVGGFPTATATGTDLAAVARGSGLAGARTVTEPGELEAAFREGLEAGRTAALVAKVEEHYEEPDVAEGFVTELSLLENRFRFQRWLARAPDGRPAGPRAP